MSMSKITVKAAAAAVVLAAALGGLGAYNVARAPDGAGAWEAVRVALDPGADYAVLHVMGMT